MHVVHGLAFFALAWLAARRTPLAWRFAAAVIVEAAWEVLENSAFIINRYRVLVVPTLVE